MNAMKIGVPWVRLGEGLKYLVGAGLLGALLLAVVQCSAAERAAKQASIQTYNFSRIAAFRDSGGAMDQRVAAFYDAAAAGRNLDEPRRVARSAIVEHATKAEALRGAIPSDQVTQYLALVRALNDTLDSTTDQTNSGRNITILGRVVSSRNQMSQRAEGSLD
ncbi:MAG TPA: hypothetical protein VK614_15155 [Allosphingosinicella sp.]|nr:hypothetical protein [Allosphingosinicella sp.]